MENIEEVNLTITLGCMKFKFHIYGLNKKFRNAQKSGIRFSQLVKFTIKIVSNLSKINICFYIKLRVQILHRQFFRIISLKPEYVKTHCNDLYFTFHSACQTWILNQSFEKNLSVEYHFSRPFHPYIIL